MKTFKIIVFAMIMICALNTMSQSLSGNVYELSKKNEKVPLTGASVYWLETTVATVTDMNGKFKLSEKGITDMRLVVMFIGYTCNTLKISKDTTTFDIQLQQSSNKLKAVDISGGGNGAFTSKINARQTQVVTTGELYKAACCNLAESFETNASVDVSYSDAITGAKQIQLLGLSGIYSQIQTENIPSVTGMASAFGLNYIPGSWMESIQISKGTSSVINGFESITGQINVEYKKPATADKLFVNIYGNSDDKLEVNANVAHKFNKKLITMLMLHGDDFQNKMDKNNDNFLDQPKVSTIDIFNRWDYIDPGKFVSRFGIKYMQENRVGGAMDFNREHFCL